MTRPKAVLVSGTILFLLCGLFPPWLFTIHGQQFTTSRRDGGCSFIFSPPTADEGVLGRHSGIELDAVRLVDEWLCVLAATGAAWLAFVPLGASRATRLILLSAGFFMVAAPVSRAQAPPVRWVQQGVSSNHMSGSGLALDGLGNIYAVGSFGGSASFGTTTLNSGGGFLAKYDSFGNVLWATQAGGGVVGVAVDGGGNAYVVGICGNPATFGNVTITNAHGGLMYFVAKASGAGTFTWAKPLFSTMNLLLYGVALETNGNFYVTGSYGGDATFATNLPNGAGFVAKFDIYGNMLWAAPAGGGGFGVAPDKAGGVFVAGGFSGLAVWGNGASQSNLTGNAVGGNMFLARYDGAGNLIWVSSSTNSFIFTGSGTPVAVGSDGSAYVAGFRYPLDTSIVCKYTAAGDQEWMHLATNTRATSIAVDSLNNAYVTGGYFGPASFDGTPLDFVSGDADIFLAKYNSAGNLQSLNGFGGSGSADGIGIAVSSLGQDIHLTGFFTPDVTLGDFTAATGTNIFGFYLASLAVQPQVPKLSLKVDSGQTPAITIQGFVGNTYQIDFTDSLQTNWHPWVRFPLPSSPFTLFDPSPNPAMRFYRAVVVQP